MRARYGVCLGMVGLAACANPQRERLERGVAFASRQFREASRNPLAAMALGNTAETGGNLSSYIYANMPDRADLPRYQDDIPSGPWSIALRALGDDKVIVAGFGDSLNEPVVAETVSVRFVPRRGP